MTIEQREEQIFANLKEALFLEKYQISIHPGSDELWNKYRKEVVTMYHEAFDPVAIANGYNPSAVLGWGASEIDYRIGEEDTTFISFEDKTSKRLAGFTYARPDDREPNDEYMIAELQTFSGTLAEYNARQKRTAFVGFTIIRPEYRSKGGWTHMMDALDTSLKKSDNYDEMTRLVRQANDYSQRIRTRYHGRIITDIPNLQSKIGLETYFRIKL